MKAKIKSMKWQTIVGVLAAAIFIVSSFVASGSDLSLTRVALAGYGGGTPTDMNQCKDNGWKAFNNPSFKNQGDCVSYVQSNPKAIGNKTK